MEEETKKDSETRDPIELSNAERIKKLEDENKQLKENYSKLYDYIRNSITSGNKPDNKNETKKSLNELFGR